MFSPVVTLAVFTLTLALCGMLAYRYGWDSRDEFADQAHRRTHR